MELLLRRVGSASEFEIGEKQNGAGFYRLAGRDGVMAGAAIGLACE
jgi:hypothetical protein